MHLNKLNPTNGALLGRVAIGQSVPGAGVELRLLGDERADLREPPRDRRRGRVRVRHPRLRDGVDDRPAARLAEPGLDDPAGAAELALARAGSSAAAPCGRRSPSTRRRTRSTSARAPRRRSTSRRSGPGTNPRTDSLIAVDLQTGQIKWWRQLIAGNQWSYDVAQPPLVYDGKVGGQRHHVVSVATMEGVWFAFDANTGAPFYERVKVIDRVEHPALQPGKPVTVFPSSLGGLNYSPASYDPATNYVFNAAAETAGVDVQAKLTPTQKKHKFVLGDVFLGLTNGNFGTELAGLARPRLDQRDRRQHRQARLEVRDAGAGARRRHARPRRASASPAAATASCARSTRRPGKVLWKFQTGHQIAAGPTIFSADGKEYIAITSAARRRRPAAASPRSCRSSSWAARRPSRRRR